LEKSNSNGWKSQTVTVGNLTVTVQSYTVTVDFHVNTINKNIKELSHTNTCILRY
jgi:4-hydroxy-3-methylbut-2-en-1-yl diphosphate synthase IspG/GcpE